MNKLLTLILVVNVLISKAQENLVSYAISPTAYIMYGLSSQTRPANPPANSIFFEVNTGKTYLSDGTSWKLNSVTAGAATLATVDEISTMAITTAKSIFVIDSLRGGTFFLYNGLDTVDNGMVFSDANNNKWLRAVVGNKISTSWYNMKSYIPGNTNAENDSYPSFMAAYNYVVNHKQFSTLYIPVDYHGTGTYQFFQTVTIDKDINIIGDGITGRPLTKIGLGQNVPGFFLASTNAAYIKIENIAFGQMTSTDSAAHGLDIRTFFHLKNVTMNGCSGNGINIRACAVPGNPDFGNVDQSIMENVQVFECNNGLYISGCDANVLDINNCSFVYNKRWGVYDNGFLGNLYRNCHFASNSQHGGVVVTYNGRWYVPVDDSITLGKRPDLFPNYWYEIPGMGGASPWNDSTKYYSGGVAIIKDINAFTAFEHCYTETNQPPVLLNSRSTYNGGTSGTEVRYGIVTKTVLGSYFINNSTHNSEVVVDRIYAGTTPTGYPSLATSSVDGFNARFTTTGSNLLVLEMENNNNPNGGIAYYDSTMLFRVKGGYSAGLGFQSMFPWNGDLAMDLGKSGQRWKDVYAQKYYGDGSNLTGITGGLNGTGFVKASGTNISYDNSTYLTTASAAATYQPIGSYLLSNGNGSSLTGLTKTQVGLANADNTSDANKPVSSSTQTALNLKQNTVSLTTTGTSGAATLIGATLNIPNYATGAGATRVFLPSDVINNNGVANTIADVTGLSFPVTANQTVKFTVYIIYNSAATTTGSRWCISFPATTFVNYYSNYTLTAASITNNQGLGASNLPAAANASSLTTNNTAIIEGIIRPSANGTFQVRFASEIAASAITAIGNGRSYLEYQVVN